MSLFCTVCEI